LLGRAGLLTSAFYVALFPVLCAQVTFWPVWLREWGLSEAEVATWLGVAILVRVVAATLLPALADRFAMRRAVIVAASAAGAAIFLAHLAAETRPVLLAMTLAAAAATAPLLPLCEALGIRASAMHGFAYAHVRAVGSLACLAAMAALGASLEALGANAVLGTTVLGLVAAAVLGAVHPGGGAPPGEGPDRSQFGEVVACLRQPVFLTFAAAASIGQASHAVFYTYSTLSWLDQGITPEVIGLLWATGVIAEIALLLGPGRRLVERIGPARALMLAGAAGVARWALMSLSPAEALLWPVQCLHALTFAVAHLGAMAFVAAAVAPRLQASAQGLYHSGLGGTVSALATLGAGQISAAHGVAATWWLAAGMSAVALVAAFRLARIWDGGRILSEPVAAG
jgi:PPP family 3-phenylpropionic acid transporter